MCLIEWKIVVDFFFLSCFFFLGGKGKRGRMGKWILYFEELYFCEFFLVFLFSFAFELR